MGGDLRTVQKGNMNRKHCKKSREENKAAKSGRKKLKKAQMKGSDRELKRI